MAKKTRPTPTRNSPSDPTSGTTGRGGRSNHAAVPHPTAPAKPAPLNLTVPAADLPAALYLVATPIGNLGDISVRALATLHGASRIACEDTRVTARLLARYGITTPTIAYHDHNAHRVLPILIKAIQDGESVAFVSDAGTPLISDPGLRLARTAIEAGLAVTTVPGPVAAIAALTLAGLPTDRFFFAGFLPPRRTARRTVLGDLATIPATLVFYEAPHRLTASLADMADLLGDRNAAIARELTKRFEEVRRGTLHDLARRQTEDGAARGEIVVIVEPPETRPAPFDSRAVDTRLRIALTHLSVRDAADLVAGETGAKRRDVYSRAVALSRERDKGS